jgi:Protein of unknown function (DUF2971)
VNIPQKLYKFRSLAGNSFRRTQHVILRNELYFAKIDSFNDPSEGQFKLGFKIDTSNSQRHQYSGMAAWGAWIMHRDIVRDSGILSLSEKCDDIVMWSHYADEHHGICLEFDATHGFFCGAKPVRYSNVLTGITQIGDRQKAAEEICLIKAEQWAYEREWRVIDATNFGNRSFPAEALSAIILGCRVSKEDRRGLKIGFHYEAEIQCCSKQSFEKGILEWMSCLVNLFTVRNLA